LKAKRRLCPSILRMEDIEIVGRKGMDSGRDDNFEEHPSS
jgi:hypothetical protein